MSLKHSNVRCIHRIGRRGLSSAVIEGICSTAAPFVAVIDGDLQHDETILPRMYKQAVDGSDVVVGTRYLEGGSTGLGFSQARAWGSRMATRLSTMVVGMTLTDPMSGFFLLRREVFEEASRALNKEGFKILLDVITTVGRARRRTGQALKISEVPYVFRARHAGESKMGPLIVFQYLGFLVSKASGGVIPSSFLLFGLIGFTGVFVHLCTLWLAFEVNGLQFALAQTVATLTAMTTNFLLNNEITYSDKKLNGGRFWLGLLTFYAACSIGALANVSVASWIYQSNPDILLAGLTGALMSVVFNYSVTRMLTWR